MFSSDYAHWDFDSPLDVFPRLPDDLSRRIFYETAFELYHFQPRAGASPQPLATGTTAASSSIPQDARTRM
jgi:hypothetical protein